MLAMNCYITVKLIYCLAFSTVMMKTLEFTAYVDDINRYCYLLLTLTTMTKPSGSLSPLHPPPLQLKQLISYNTLNISEKFTALIPPQETAYAELACNYITNEV